MYPRDTRITANGLSFHYRQWSEEGPLLLLLHGLASTARIWDLVAPRLTERFTVIALDQRGHGESEQPDGGYGFAEVVEDLRQVLRRLRAEQVVLAGHSWGGNVALEFAARHPEAVSRLVLVDGGFLDLSADPEMTWERTEKLLTPPDLVMPQEEYLQRAPDWLGPAWSEAVAEIVLANVRTDERGWVHPRLERRHHMRIVRALWEQRPRELYPRVQCPTLVIPAEPPEGQWSAIPLDRKRTAVARAEQGLCASTTEWMPDTVHDIPLQRPAELASVIDRFVPA